MVGESSTTGTSSLLRPAVAWCRSGGSPKSSTRRPVLYLIFNEGYAATSGPLLHRVELSAEAIRLARIVHRLLPDDAELVGLLAHMLLTDACRPARSGPAGELIPMAEQNRSLWNADHIAEGVALITEVLRLHVVRAHCWTGPVTTSRRMPAISRPRAVRPACRSSATCTPAPPS